MNDISLKIVESPKSHGGVEVSPNAEAVVDNEVDPLAIDEAELDKLKEVSVPVPQEEADEKSIEKAGNCDENAKEKSLSENRNESSDNFVNVITGNEKGKTVVAWHIKNCSEQNILLQILYYS